MIQFSSKLHCSVIYGIKVKIWQAFINQEGRNWDKIYGYGPVLTTNHSFNKMLFAFVPFDCFDTTRCDSDLLWFYKYCESIFFDNCDIHFHPKEIQDLNHTRLERISQVLSCLDTWYFPPHHLGRGPGWQNEWDWLPDLFWLFWTPWRCFQCPNQSSLAVRLAPCIFGPGW